MQFNKDDFYRYISLQRLQRRNALIKMKFVVEKMYSSENLSMNQMKKLMQIIKIMNI